MWDAIPGPTTPLATATTDPEVGFRVRTLITAAACCRCLLLAGCCPWQPPLTMHDTRPPGDLVVYRTALPLRGLPC